MRDINRKAWQFQEAAETEMGAWHVDVWPNGCMVTRWGTQEEASHQITESDKGKVTVERQEFRDEGEAKRYVALVAIEAGLRAIGAL